MKTLFYISITLSILATSVLTAQDFNGVATYKTQRKMDIEMDSTQVSSDMQAQMMAMLKKQFEKEFTLEFTTTESYYKEAEQLDAPTQGGNPGIQVMVAGDGAGDLLYKNLEENRYTRESDLFGKIFLIQDELEQPQWEMTKETKNIGEYTCFKATFKRMTRSTGRMTMQVNPTAEDEMPEPEEVEQTVTAWYTLKIPVQHGPGNYSGLPGLILEVNDGVESILCSKIVLNPKKGVKIEEPKKGKKVSQEEFDTIMEKKMREMDERFNSNRHNNDGNSVEIRIGG